MHQIAFSLPSSFHLYHLVLTRDDTLEKLEKLQSLDALFDVEGCAAIFERLSNLCNGNRQSAMEHVANARDMPLTDDFRELQGWLQKLERGLLDLKHAEAEVKSGHSFSPLLLKILRLAECRQYQRQGKNVLNLSLKDSSTVGVKQIEVLEQWVQSLNLKECVSFLQIWLLALGAKDASFVITLSPCTKSSSPSWSHFSRLIDLGPKPISKISTKIVEEERLCEKANIAEDALKCL